MKNDFGVRPCFISLILILLISRSSICFGAFEKGTTGARPDALGGVFVSAANNEYAAFYNPAGLSLLERRALSFSFARPYSLRELQHYTGVFAFPIKKACLAGAWSLSGFSLYREESMQFSAGFPLGKWLRAGGSLKYQRISISRYGERGTPDGDAGILILINESWTIGGSVSNIAALRIGGIPLACRSTAFGICRRTRSRGLISVDCETDAGNNIFFCGGAELILRDNIALRLGYRDRERTLSAGMGISLKKYSVDYTLIDHAVLGMTHSATITIHV